MKTKLLKIVRANFSFKYSVNLRRFYAIERDQTKQFLTISSINSFDVIVKMLEHIYPQGKHYKVMRHSRRFKQARRKEAVGVVEIACVVGFVALVVIAILNSCCGAGVQY